jgi:hypothetical protein
MKKFPWVILATLFLAACNNSADSDKDVIDADSFNASEKKELNNRNTGAYDSAQQGDTSSYERMPNKVTDSVPK